MSVPGGFYDLLWCFVVQVQAEQRDVGGAAADVDDQQVLRPLRPRDDGPGLGSQQLESSVEVAAEILEDGEHRGRDGLVDRVVDVRDVDAVQHVAELAAHRRRRHGRERDGDVGDRPGAEFPRPALHERVAPAEQVAQRLPDQVVAGHVGAELRVVDRVAESLLEPGVDVGLRPALVVLVGAAADGDGERRRRRRGLALDD